MLIHNVNRLINRFSVFKNLRNWRNINTSAINYKIVKFKIYDLGEGITEFQILQWNKNEGDRVEEMENLLTVQNDKATIDITSKYSGVLVKKCVNENEMAKVGSFLCEIDTEDDVHEAEEADASSTAEEEEENYSKDNNAYSDEGTSEYEDRIDEGERKHVQTSVKASPAVRKKAKECGLELQKISAYFKKDVITLNDVEAYLKNAGEESTSKKKNSNYKKGVCEEATTNEKEEVVLKGIQLAMCKIMNATLSTPIFHINEPCNVTNLIKLKNCIKQFSAEHDVKITITSLLIKFTSIALNDFPMLNSTFNEKKNSYTIYKNHNVCVAIDTENGLLVPNIKNVNKKTVLQIQEELNLLREKAINKKLSKSDISDGTITISNYGVIGGSFGTPIIYDNQACIIGVSKTEKKIVLKNGKTELTSLNDLTVEDTLNLTYGADHRYIDGATIAQFSNRLRMLIENPYCTLKYLK